MQGPTEFTETLNRITVTTLAIIIKTRGVAEAELLLFLQAMLDQILASSHHTWSEKTLRYFPSIMREALIGRIDNRNSAVQAWQQVNLIILLSLQTYFFTLPLLISVCFLYSVVFLSFFLKVFF